jgi:hypothetical protein
MVTTALTSANAWGAFTSDRVKVSRVPINRSRNILFIVDLLLLVYGLIHGILDGTTMHQPGGAGNH